MITISRLVRGRLGRKGILDRQWYSTIKGQPPKNGLKQPYIHPEKPTSQGAEWPRFILWKLDGRAGRRQPSFWTTIFWIWGLVAYYQMSIVKGCGIEEYVLYLIFSMLPPGTILQFWWWLCLCMQFRSHLLLGVEPLNAGSYGEVRL
jgi:hypothetical protein